MVPMVALTSSLRRAPQYWPMMTVPPEARPMMSPVTVIMIWLPVDTAATPAVSAKRPTTVSYTHLDVYKRQE